MLVVIGGTTASGKSTLALNVAQAIGAEIVNADSRQVYRDLGLLTARPTAADTERVRHHLYGYLDADQQNSAGDWLRKIEPVLSYAIDEDRPLVVVGGTGLYIKALLEGLPAMPDIPGEIREAIAGETAAWPSTRIHARLAVEDPVMARRLRPSDRQRLLRALEVMRATGISLADWQTRPLRRLSLPQTRLGVAIVPDRGLCAARIEQRLEVMLRAGSCDQIVETLRHHPTLEDLPLARTTGVPELLAYLKGRIGLGEARRRTLVATRHYAKRQRTWFRHQSPDLPVIRDVGENLSFERLMMHCKDSVLP